MRKNNALFVIMVLFLFGISCGTMQHESVAIGGPENVEVVRARVTSKSNILPGQSFIEVENPADSEECQFKRKVLINADTAMYYSQIKTGDEIFFVLFSLGGHLTRINKRALGDQDKNIAMMIMFHKKMIVFNPKK